MNPSIWMYGGVHHDSRKSAKVPRGTYQTRDTHLTSLLSNGSSRSLENLSHDAHGS